MQRAATRSQINQELKTNTLDSMIPGKSLRKWSIEVKHQCLLINEPEFISSSSDKVNLFAMNSASNQVAEQSRSLPWLPPTYEAQISWYLYHDTGSFQDKKKTFVLVWIKYLWFFITIVLDISKGFVKVWNRRYPVFLTWIQ